MDAAVDQPAGFVELLGRFHPALVHVPIAWLLLVVLLDVLTFSLRRDGFGRWGLYTLIGTTVALLPACLTGLLRAGPVAAASPAAASLVAVHRGVMLGTIALTAVALAVRLGRRNRLEGAWKAAYLALIGTAFALVMIGAHLGGRIVFG